MSKEIVLQRVEKREVAIQQELTRRVLPSINRTFGNLDLASIDSSKLITKISFMDADLDGFKEKRKAATPIEKIFPYTDDLVNLGVNRDIIEDHFRNITMATHYDRDILNNPSELFIPKNRLIMLGKPLISMTVTLAAHDVLGLPRPKEIKEPRMQSVVSEVLKKHMIRTTLQNIITDSGLDFRDSKFNQVKTRIGKDIDSHTRFFFHGAEILGILDGQTLDNCAFRASSHLNAQLVHFLTTPVMQSALAGIEGLNPIEANVTIQDFKKDNKEAIALIKEAVGIDFNQEITPETKGDWMRNYKLLLDLYINSQVPLIAMDQFI